MQYALQCMSFQTLEQENRELKSNVEDSRLSINHLMQLSSSLKNEVVEANDKIRVSVKKYIHYCVATLCREYAYIQAMAKLHTVLFINIVKCCTSYSILYVHACDLIKQVILSRVKYS